nr:MAG TPA: hypothetical protein [Caudoviricetes sp.]
MVLYNFQFTIKLKDKGFYLKGIPYLMIYLLF